MKKLDNVIMPNQIQMQPVLKAAEAFWIAEGQELVVTCGMDGIHSAGSFHYYGFAVDLRTNYFSEAVAQKLGRKLREHLQYIKHHDGSFGGYDVIVHKTHIHIEYDDAKRLI